MEDITYLVTRMKEGDRNAFDEVYERYKDKLIRMAYLITGNMSDSEDVVQETFVKCFIYCKSLKNNAGFQSWLFQILHRTAILQYKRMKREMPDEEIVTKMESNVDVEKNSALEQCLVNERTHAVTNAIQKLNIKQRTVVVYYYYNQMSTKEIAKVCECREGTVKSRLFTARRVLKDELKAYEQEGVYHEKCFEI